MLDILARVWDNLVDRTEGPMNLRFLIQPAVTLFFAIKAAMRDAKSGEVPYLERFINFKGERKSIVAETWKDVGKVFFMGTVLDVIYQLVVIFGLKTGKDFYPLESLLVAFILAILPYILFRGPLSRIFRNYKR